MKAKTGVVERNLWSDRLDNSVRLVANELDDEVWERRARPIIVTRVFEPVEGETTKTHSEGRAIDARISFRDVGGFLSWYLPLDIAMQAAEAVNSRLWLTTENGDRILFSSGNPMLPVVVHQDPRDSDVWHYHIQVARSKKVFRIS